ncbi:MAG: hypothetical protein ABW022_10695 [Actinoplanes sp.]
MLDAVADILDLTDKVEGPYRLNSSLATRPIVGTGAKLRAGATVKRFEPRASDRVSLVAGDLAVTRDMPAAGVDLSGIDVVVLGSR